MLQPAAGHDLFEWTIIQAFGIFAVSVSGHSSLPVLRNSMAKPEVCQTQQAEPALYPSWPNSLRP